MDTENNVELELRAEVAPHDRERIRRSLEQLGLLHSHTKRLSVMYFGTVGQKKLDIRVRTTNGECEVVLKVGTSFGAHNRVESVQLIQPEQFLGMVEIFSQFGFETKVGERETFNYRMTDNITVSLVYAGPISYIELEKMSRAEESEQNRKQLEYYATQLKLQILQEDEFNDLCARLNEKADLAFDGSDKEYTQLKEHLRQHIENQNKSS